MKKSMLVIFSLLIIVSCQKEPENGLNDNSSDIPVIDDLMDNPNTNGGNNPVTDWIEFTFGNNIDLNNPPNYASQIFPKLY